MNSKGKTLARLGALVMTVCGAAGLCLAVQLQTARDAYAQSTLFTKLASYPTYLANTNQMTVNMHTVETGIGFGLILFIIGLVAEKG